MILRDGWMMLFFSDEIRERRSPPLKYQHNAL